MPINFGRPSSVTIIPQTATPLLESWRLDGATSVGRNFPGSVSRFPVQSGAEGITDAVDIDPDTLSVSGLLTDTPVFLGPIISQPDRAARMSDLLIKLREQRQALEVVTRRWGSLRNRWISSFTLTESRETSAISVTLTIEKLRIVRTQLVSAQLDTDIRLLGMSTVTVGEF